MAKKSDKIIAVVFVTFLAAMMVINFITPDRVFSQRENRYLAKRPGLSLGSIINGRFSRQFEEYITDEFFLRDRWVLVKSDVERMLLRTENNGIYFARGGYLLENYRKPGAAIEWNISRINRFAESFPNIPTFVMLAPNSVAIYPDKLPAFASVYDQIKVIQRVEQEVDSRLGFIPVYEALNRQRDEYIYFRTDHHWTMRGAYYAYQELARGMGLEPLPTSSFRVETVSTDFWGTYFSRANNRHLQSDSIEVFYPRNPIELNISFNDKEGVFDSLYFPSHLETRDQYSLFLDGNHPLAVIKTDVDNDRRLMIFKDSFAHSLIPFLASHFQEIHIIDLRFFNQNIGEYVESNGITETVFLFSVSGFSRDSTLVNFR